ncbi:hypothetical protein [Pseudomonas sp. MWU12-2345]|uniref:hypothetical protein n=1 Tax=Pseudomonas sp. MWU12-2345 TaxID=2928689 RepID=UPI0020108116|nr:hypothetical protein [Pseudomonas sp. MWU12-2345]
MRNNQSCINAGAGSACPKKLNDAAISATAQIADDALELLRATHERLMHMRTLFCAIKADHRDGRHLHTADLSDLGGFLGDDWGNYIDDQIGHMQKGLDAAEVAQ